MRIRDRGGDASGSEIFSNDQATVFLFGSEFDRPFGAVTDTTGIISGILSDGTSFSYDFQRQSTASIILAVPEPSSSLLLGLVSIGLFLTRSRKRQKLDSISCLWLLYPTNICEH